MYSSLKGKITIFRVDNVPRARYNIILMSRARSFRYGKRARKTGKKAQKTVRHKKARKIERIGSNRRCGSEE